MDFLKASHDPFVIAAASARLVLSTLKEQKGHGCDIPLKLCVGALPGHILTLLASFHTVTVQYHPHSHGKVKTPSAHVWVSTDSTCVKRC